MALLTNPLMTGFDQGVDAPPRWNGLVPDDARGPLTVGDPTDPASMAGTQVGVDAARDIVEQTYAKMLAAQQQAADQGQWTGGQVWQGGHPTGAGMLDAIGQMGTAVALGTGGDGAIKPTMPIRAFHATDEPFPAYDWSRLGQFTRRNVTDADNPESFGMNLAELGPWAHEKPLAKLISQGTDLPVEIGGEGKTFGSLDELHGAIKDAGGPQAFRSDLISEGFGHVKVKDEEFDGYSYIGLTPEAFRVVPGTGSGGDAPAPGFTAYHGSPHAFDQFDLSKIGTGEGAQAYWHGIYLADDEPTAAMYREILCNPAWFLNGQ